MSPTFICSDGGDMITIFARRTGILVALSVAFSAHRATCWLVLLRGIEDHDAFAGFDLSAPETGPFPSDIFTVA